MTGGLAAVVTAALLAAAVLLATRAGPTPGPRRAVGSWLSRVRGLRRERCEEPEGPDLPLLAELVAAAVRAGLPPARALEVALDVTPGEAPAQLRRVCAQLNLGGDPVTTWAEVDQRWRPVADPLVLSALTGAPAASLLVSAAATSRSERRRVAEEAAARLGALLVLPLGLCTLPSFLLLGVIPVVLVLAGDLMG
ncbi:MAG: type II secretion system F family protein [Janthinobacterium lividum]